MNHPATGAAMRPAEAALAGVAAGAGPAVTAGAPSHGGTSAARRTRRQETAKRLFDIALGAGLLLFLLPALCLIALAVRADGGPVLYAHRRVGRGGAEFPCLKFRTMAVGADRRLEAVLRDDPARRREWETGFKLRDDPRVTRLGRLLRATSLDELPQLLNVLRGEMSLVGPRPVVRRELEEFYGPAGAAAYLSLRPGLTGPWQVGGRSDTGYAERVALDAAYARDASLRLDLVILWRTVGAVLRRHGAY